jgi:hypothetical protein
MHCLL